MASVVALAEIIEAGRETLTVREAEEIAAAVEGDALLAAFRRPVYSGPRAARCAPRVLPAPARRCVCGRDLADDAAYCAGPGCHRSFND